MLASPHQLYINPVISSEYLYHLLGILGGRAPMSIAESGKVGEALAEHQTSTFLSLFEQLPIRTEGITLAISFMKKHNLLPNDAMILASCCLEGVPVLASYDSDFTGACREEGIRLLNDASEV
ncbi:MAG: PIN domain-containing protein [Bacteroidia bacterium]|nr:PIN domain-containing protein [Bacteroidia bacterium]